MKSGDKYGRWLVVDVDDYQFTKTGHKRILCECECGERKYQYPYLLKHRKSLGCRACCAKDQYKGVGDLSASFLSDIKRNAKKRNLKFEVTPEFLWELFLQQGGKCALSGLEIVMMPQKPPGMTVKEKRQLHTASLDRIDSSKPYVEGNVQWVHKRVNQIKMDMEQSEFIALCEQVYITTNLNI